MLTLGNVTFDCADPRRLAAFWSEALGYTVSEQGEYFAALTPPDGSRPRLLFIAVPEPRTVKNRVHIDCGTDDREAEIERLLGLGATRGETHSMFGMTWTVLQDPEGNEFCVAGSSVSS